MSKSKSYLKGLKQGKNPAQAARDAGYAESSVEKGRYLYTGAHKQFLKENKEIAGLTQAEIIEGIKEAINDAKLLEDPATQIRGWSELAKITGLNAPQKVEVDVQHTHLQSMPTEKLLKLAGDDPFEIIDGECEEVDAEEMH